MISAELWQSYASLNVDLALNLIIGVSSSLCVRIMPCVLNTHIQRQSHGFLSGGGWGVSREGHYPDWKSVAL